jgi:hypothetical protein
MTYKNTTTGPANRFDSPHRDMAMARWSAAVSQALANRHTMLSASSFPCRLV